MLITPLVFEIGSILKKKSKTHPHYTWNQEFSTQITCFCMKLPFYELLTNFCIFTKKHILSDYEEFCLRWIIFRIVFSNAKFTTLKCNKIKKHKAQIIQSTWIHLSKIFYLFTKKKKLEKMIGFNDHSILISF